MSRQAIYLIRNSDNFYYSQYAAGKKPLYAPALGSGQIYHVSKFGSDSSAGSASYPFLTIDKAMSVVGPGDTIQVHAGVYQEHSSQSLCAVMCYTGGAVGNPITLMAYPGDESSVIIDGGGTRMGVQANCFSNWQFWGLRVRNAKTYGFNNWVQETTEVPNDLFLSKNVLIENCYVHDVEGEWGDNISGIGPWSTKDWIIRNTKIRNVSALPPSGGENPTVTSAVQWYQAINLLIENIDCDTQYGISAKDHFLDSVDPVRVPSRGVTARYNRIKASHAGFRSSIRAGNSPEAGDQFLLNNIIYGLQAATAEAGIVYYMDGATGQSKKFRAAHNIVDMTNAPGAPIMEAQLSDAIEFFGNVGVGANLNLSILAGSSLTYKTLLTQCDYNIYTAEQWILDRYGASSAQYTSLTAIKALLSGAKPTLGVNNPENHSLIQASTNFFNNLAANDYTLKPSGPLFNFVPGGKNAGAYENGNETIGLLPGYCAG